MSFNKGGQEGIYHRCEGSDFAYGYFHTYDRLQPRQDAEPHKVHILLPADYEDGAPEGRRWPVLYFNDGNTVFWPGGCFNKTWNLTAVMSELVRNQPQIEPVIVVAVVPNDREREYTDVEWAPGRAYGGLNAYAGLLADVIKPWVDSTYSTVPDAHRTCIAGSSHGGLAALYVAATRPRQFGLCIAFSPSLWVGQSYLRLMTSSAAIPGSFSPSTLASDHALIGKLIEAARNRAPRPRLYLGWGLCRGGGFHNWCIERWATDTTRAALAQITRSAEDGGGGYTTGVDVFLHEDPDGEHTEESWHRWIPLALRQFYSSHQPELDA